MWFVLYKDLEGDWIVWHRKAYDSYLAALEEYNYLLNEKADPDYYTEVKLVQIC